MNFAIHCKVLRCLPTIFALATFDASWSLCVSSPIATLIWLHLLTKRQLEVSVGDLAISIRIKVVKELYEIVLSRSHSPMR